MIDANVLVSALLSNHDNAATVQIVGKPFSGQAIPLFSEEILREYDEVLRQKKFVFSEETASSFVHVTEKYGAMIISIPQGEILSDMKDFPFMGLF